ncbi:MAG: HD domain-containing phosphohydrolase, partial [Chthonomonadales bacterium]
MPVKAQFYWLGVIALGIAAVAFVCLRPEMPLKWSWMELVLFVIFAALAGHWKVRLIPKGPLEHAGSMSLGSALTFAGMLHFGLALGMLIGIVASLAACLYRVDGKPRQPWRQLVFNLSLTAISAIAFNFVLNAIYKHPPGIVGYEGFPAVAAGSLAYWLINTGGVATIIALVANETAYVLWRKTFLWTAPGYFAGASISLFSVACFQSNTAAILIIAVPIAYLTKQSYETYTRRAEEREKHIEELQEKKDQLSQLYVATIKSLATAIDAKDQYTHQHIIRVQKYAMAIAHEMGICGDELQGLETGALLHDIGKLGVPEYVLLKPGRLNAEEFEKIKKHPEIGAAILDQIDFPWPVIPVVKSHHERWDGTGYP